MRNFHILILLTLLSGSAQAHWEFGPVGNAIFFWLLPALAILAFPLLVVLTVLDTRRADWEGRRGFRLLWIFCAVYFISIIALIIMTVFNIYRELSFFIWFVIIPLLTIIAWIYAPIAIYKYVKAKRSMQKQ